MPNNDETRINFDKHVPLRDKMGNLIGEALVTMRHGIVIISAEIKPNSTLGQELMRHEGPMIVGWGDMVQPLLTEEQGQAALRELRQKGILSHGEQ